MNYKAFEKAIKRLVNKEFTVNSENFDRFEIDIISNNYSTDLEVKTIFKKPFSGRDADKADDLRYEIKNFILKFFPQLEGVYFGFSKSTDEVYHKQYKPYYDSLKGNNQITEELRNFNNSFLLTEASKIKVLTGKLGLSQEVAEELDRLCGPLSVWMANKLIDYVIANNNYVDKKDAVNFINERTLGRINIGYIQGIMDYIRVGLDGNTSTIKNLNYEELKYESKKWHDSLKVSGGEVNYKEPHTHDILVDKRDENGFGFYWVDLNTNSSDEECRRMGHCGRTNNANTILSLRETKPYPGNPKYTINTSHLTAAVGNNDGILYQLKGPKNSKPNEEYNDLILPLFYILGGGGEQEDYFIQGFGSEYAAERDFKLTDLPDNTIKSLYQDRPDLFNTRSLRRKLVDMGVIEGPKIDWVVEIDIPADRVDSYVNGGWTVRNRKRKTPGGGEYTERVDIFETILSGDMWGMWDNWDADWEGAIDYYVDKKNEEKIWDLLKGMAGEEFDEHLSLKDAIEEYDGDHQIRSAITSSVNDAESSSYENYLYKNLKDALEEWGEVIQMDDSGVKLRVDVANFIDGVDENYLDEYMENCNDDIKCLFEELVGQGDIDKPKFSIDDRWYPDINHDEFNDMLSDRLSEI